MKAFGKELFNKNKPTELYDFAQHGLVGSNRSIDFEAFAAAVEIQPEDEEPLRKAKAKVDKPIITPKNLYKLEALNIPDLGLKCDPAYIEQESHLIERKLKLILKNKGSDYGQIKYGREELESLLLRLNNRLQYDQYKRFFEEYPYTTSAQIDTVVRDYSNLRTRRVEEFVPDLPAEAIEVMEQYNKQCKKLCGLPTVFYIIADKKDFQKHIEKRDPVLLAQSPFGLIWQILGAWDEEMVLLDEL
jgi:hypothetical protein